MGSGGSVGFGNLVLEVPLPDSMDGGAKNTIEKVLDFRLNDVIELAPPPKAAPPPHAPPPSTLRRTKHGLAAANTCSPDEIVALPEGATFSSTDATNAAACASASAAPASGQDASGAPSAADAATDAAAPSASGGAAISGDAAAPMELKGETSSAGAARSRSPGAVAAAASAAAAAAEPPTPRRRGILDQVAALGLAIPPELPALGSFVEVELSDAVLALDATLADTEKTFAECREDDPTELPLPEPLPLN